MYTHENMYFKNKLTFHKLMPGHYAVLNTTEDEVLEKVFT